MPAYHLQPGGRVHYSLRDSAVRPEDDRVDIPDVAKDLFLPDSTSKRNIGTLPHHLQSRFVHCLIQQNLHRGNTLSVSAASRLRIPARGKTVLYDSAVRGC